MDRDRWIEVTTLGDMLDRRAVEHPDAAAVVFPDARYSYAEVAALAERYARGLLGLGVGPGDRIGYFLPECIDTLGILFGAAKIGAVTAPINARFKSYELSQVVRHAGMKVIFTASPDVGTDYAGLLAETFGSSPNDTPELASVVVLSGGPHPGMIDRAVFDAVADGVDSVTVNRRQQAVRVRDCAVIMYTSGTTAMPKGAMLSHEAFLRFADATANGRMPMRANDTVWTALPLFHIGGVAFAIVTLFAGATFAHVGYFDPGVALGQLRDERATIALPGFETIWLPVLRHPERTTDDLAALRVLLCSGTTESLRQIQAATPDAALVLCFGMTEACAFLSLSEIDDPLDLRITTGGLPMPGMEVELHDPDTARLLEPPAVGELWFRGPMAFDGYFRDAELTRSVFDDRGYFRTGDVASIDAGGRVTFVSRVKDMLKVGGENVAAAEVEGYLMTHPAVRLAQVVAAPDAKYVEVPAAFVELEPGAEIEEQELIDYCRGEIATFRVPRYVRFVAEWPMSGTKVKKFELRERIADELRAAGIVEASAITSG